MIHIMILFGICKSQRDDFFHEIPAQISTIASQDLFRQVPTIALCDIITASASVRGPRNWDQLGTSCSNSLTGSYFTRFFGRVIIYIYVVIGVMYIFYSYWGDSR